MKTDNDYTKDHFRRGGLIGIFNEQYRVGDPFYGNTKTSLNKISKGDHVRKMANLGKGKRNENRR